MAGRASSRSDVAPNRLGTNVDIVVIQVDELEARFVEDRAQPGLVEHELGVAAMARPLGDEDFAAPPSVGRPRPPRARRADAC